MSKYHSLWEYVGYSGLEEVELTFDDILGISGVAMDQSFLTYEKELSKYGYHVEKISQEEQTVIFRKGK